jgi:hypothetical protein
VAGRRTKQNLIDVLTMHYNTIAPLALAPPAIAPPTIAPPVNAPPGVGVSTGISAPSGITLNSMFDSMDNTYIDVDSLWNTSFTSIAGIKTVLPVKTAFQDLTSALRQDIPVHRFVLLLHSTGDLSIYFTESDDHLVLRTRDLGAETPSSIRLDKSTMTWVLDTIAVDRYRRVAENTANNFIFDSQMRVNRKRNIATSLLADEGDEETTDNSSSAHHLLAFQQVAKAMKSVISKTSKSLTAQGQQMSEKAAKSFTLDSDRLLSTGASPLFQQIKYPPSTSTIPYRWFPDWQRSDPFLIQLQCGHLLKLFRGWDLVPIEYFADLLGKYDTVQAEQLSIRISQSINSNHDIDETIR